MCKFHWNKNAIKNLVCNLQEKYLAITHNVGGKPVKYLSEEAIRMFKYMTYWAAIRNNQSVEASGKKSIYMKSAA